MRANMICLPTRPARKGKRHWLGGCAIAAGMMAMALGGPAHAQGVAGSGQVVSGSATISPPAGGAPANTTNVVTSSNQTIINWTPTDTAPTGAPINFLPAGNTLNYFGAGQYTVLNRFVAINPLTGLPIPISRQIALSGTVNSFIGSPFATSGNVQGGNIWFFNAGGILINSGAAINVGSLLLTANDIDTTGGLFGPGGTIRFRGASASTSAIEVQQGSFIGASNANPGSSFVALVAPRIIQNGIVNSDGSIAYVAAEQADIRINNGLFDINVLVGAEGGNVITHSGVSTGPAHQQGDANDNRIYLVAIPKNDAVTMLVGGQLGYQDAVVAQADPDGAVRLSAGFNVTGGELDAAPVNATSANMTVADVIFRSSVVAHASGNFVGQPLAMIPSGVPGPSAPPPQLGRIFIQGDGTFIGDASATLTANTGRQIIATGNLSVISDGANGQPGSAAINVNNGVLVAGGAVAVLAGGRVQADGSSRGGNASLSIVGGQLGASSVQVAANAIGGIGGGGAGGTGTGGNASITVSNAGAQLQADTISVAANGFGGFSTNGSKAGTGIGGTATMDLRGGTLNAVDARVEAAGFGGSGSTGGDDATLPPVGVGGDGIGGNATINLNGTAVVTTQLLGANAAGVGGFGGDFLSLNGGVGNSADGGVGNGGNAIVNLTAGTLTTADLFADAGGFGGTGGSLINSGSSSSPTGVGIGGKGGTGQGGTATIVVSTPVTATGQVGSFALGFGGLGGQNQTGGAGGAGIGGSAGVVVDNLAFGTVDAIINAEALGGTGGNAFDGLGGAGGGGGNGNGGTARLTVQGANGSATVNPDNLAATGTGGDVGGSDSIAPTSNGGNGTGGTVELLALGGALTLAPPSSAPMAIRSSGVGGNGTVDGNGTGGTVNLIARGGSVGSNGGPLDIFVNGTGTTTQGGTVLLSSEASGSGPSTITLGATTINANGDSAGRIEILSANVIRLTSLTAEAIGTAAPTNNDPDTAPAGIFLAATGGTIQTDGAMSLTTGSTVGIFARSNGMVNVGGNLAIQANDQVAIRHDVRVGTAPTVQTGGSLSVQAGNSISGAPGSLLDAGTTLTLQATNGAIGVDSLNAGDLTLILAQGNGVVVSGTSTSGTDLAVNAFGPVTIANASAGDDISVRGATLTLGTLTTDGSGPDSELDGATIFLSSSGATTVTHAEADNDFIAVVGSFVTGLNSIITGGDISINSPGAVNLGNSTAGGIISVDGQSIAFNTLNAGTTVGLNATGTASGAEGINGAAIVAGGDINLSGNSIAITNAIQGGGSLFAFAAGGRTAIQLATVDGNIAIFADGDVTGEYDADGDILLASGANITATARARGGFVNPNSGTANGDLFVDAVGDIVLTGSSAARMFGVNAGRSATLTGAAAGEDLLVGAGTTASLADASAGDDVSVTAGGVITALRVRATGQGGDSLRLFYAPNGSFAISQGEGGSEINGADIVLTSANGAINGTMLSAGDDIALTASNGALTVNGAVTLGLGITGGDSTIKSTSLTGSFAGLNAHGDVDLTVQTGTTSLGTVLAGRDIIVDVNATADGTLTAGRDIGVTFFAASQLGALNAGDDIRLGGTGNLTTGNLTTTGLGGDNEADGSNIILISTGSTTVTGANAANDISANVGSFQTGSDGLVAGGSIDLVASGTTNMGNATAGGAIRASGQSVAFNMLTAGDTISLTAAEAVNGGSANAANFISVDAGTDISGTFVSGASIELTAGDDVNATARANGGFIGSSGGTAANGDLFVDADGDVVLTGSSAARMFGVNAGRSATLTGAAAGEDLLVRARTTANLADVRAGDDVSVTAGGAITALRVSATGQGSDSLRLFYDDETGFAIGQGEGGSEINGADIVLRSTNGAINGTILAAGDDIVLTAATSLAVDGATTSGLGTTGGDSSITAQSGNASLANLNAFSDIGIGSTGAVTVTGQSRAGRDVMVAAASADFANLAAAPSGAVPNTVEAGRNLSVTTSGAITSGRFQAGGSLSLTGNGVAITRAATIGGGQVSLVGTTGVSAAGVNSSGATVLTAVGGAIGIDSLASAGPVAANGDSISITGTGDLVFAQLNSDIGDAIVSNSGAISVTSGTVAARARLTVNGNQRLAITRLNARNIDLSTGGNLDLTDVAATDTLTGVGDDGLIISGVVTGRTIDFRSGDIDIGSAGRIGTAGTTEALSLTNSDTDRPTFVGGTGSRNGYHIDAAEMTRLFGTDIIIFANRVRDTGEESVGSATPPDLVIDDFTITAGTATSNLGANGSLTLTTPGKARVLGDVRITGVGDANSFAINADDALEVILGEGSIALTGPETTRPGGRLILSSDDVIVATRAAITDVGNATTTDAIDDRLAINDGIVLDSGSLIAGGIDVSVIDGFYVQNSGASDKIADRRGLTFGALGLNIDTESSSTRIVINGQHAGPSGAVTGLDAITLVMINGVAAGASGGSSGSSGSSSSFDALSTINGCLIVNVAGCTPLFGDSHGESASFPVQDIIEENEDEDGEGATGTSIVAPLIVLRDLDPTSGEPLLDDPVTGAGNDDLWVPPVE